MGRELWIPASTDHTATQVADMNRSRCVKAVDKSQRKARCRSGRRSRQGFANVLLLRLTFLAEVPPSVGGLATSPHRAVKRS